VVEDTSFVGCTDHRVKTCIFGGGSWRGGARSQGLSVVVVVEEEGGYHLARVQFSSVQVYDVVLAV